MNSTARTRLAIGEVLAGTRHGPRSAVLFAGSAIIASVACMNPGNYAANILAGATGADVRNSDSGFAIGLIHCQVALRNVRSDHFESVTK